MQMTGLTCTATLEAGTRRTCTPILEAVAGNVYLSWYRLPAVSDFSTPLALSCKDLQRVVGELQRAALSDRRDLQRASYAAQAALASNDGQSLYLALLDIDSPSSFLFDYTKGTRP